jgi:HSP20 family molecular chaperone IbpA
MRISIKIALTSILSSIITAGSAMADSSPYPSSFDRPDPIAEVQQMRERMKQRMQDFNGRHSFHNLAATDTSADFESKKASDISKREDQSFVYYDVKVDAKNTAVNTKIENGYLTVTGSTQKKEELNEANRQAKSEFNSAFTNKFLLPKNVDANKMQMSYEKDKVVLKFPKINS